MDWLRSEDLKEEKNVTAPIVIIASPCRLSFRRGWLGVPLGMHPTSPEYFGLTTAYVARNVLLREEPEEDDEEERDDGEEDNDGDEGYSE